jgi:hypothetical protein
MKRLAVVALSLLAVAAWLTASATPADAQDGLDCEDFESQAEAQAYYRENPDDPTGNDADNDGIACELFDFADSATDYEPVSIGADTATTTTTTTMAATGTGSAVVDQVARSANTATVAALLTAAGVCGSMAVRAWRRA